MQIMLINVKNWFRDTLLRSQSVTGTDNIYIAKQGFWAAAGFLMNTALGLATIWVFANLVPRESYGIYKYLIALIGSLGFLMLSGIKTAVAQAVARGYEGALAYSTRVQLLWNIAYIAVGAGIGGWYLWHGNGMFGWSLLILAFGTALTNTYKTYGHYLNGKKEFRRSTIYGVLSTLFYGVTVLLAILASSNVLVWIVAYTVGSLAPALFFHSLVMQSIKARSDDNASERALIRFGGHLTLANVPAILAQQLDKILLFQFIGPASLAVYAFAALGTDHIKGLLKGIGAISSPRLTERSLPDIDRVFHRRTFQTMAIGATASIVYIILAPLAFDLLFPLYQESVIYSQVLSLSLIGTMAGTYMGNVFNAKKMVRTIYLSTTGTRFLQITLFVSLGYVWGIWGMVTATVVTNLSGIGYNFFLWELAMRRAEIRQR